MSPFVEDPKLWMAHEPGVRALARRLLDDLDQSEDVVQETWLAALRNRGPLKDPGAWLRGVVRHLALRVRRGEGRRAVREAAAAKREGLPSVASIVEREATRRRVLGAVLELDEPYRSAILLRYFENLPPRDLARRLGVPVETVRTRLKRGITRMRRGLEREERGGELRQQLGALALAGIGAKGLALGGATTASAVGVTVMASKVKVGIVVVALLVLLPLLWVQLRGDGEESTPEWSDRAGAATPLAGEIDDEKKPDEGPGAVKTVPFEEKPPPEKVTEAEAVAGDLKVTVTAPDGSPAGDVEVRMLPWGAPNPFFSDRYARTDEKGEVVFREVRRGGVTLMAQPGGWGRARIEGGKENEATIEIPAGFAITGVVVDPDDRPVAGATIILARSGAINVGRPYGRSDSQGRFTVPNVEKGLRSIGARAPGWAPTPMILLIAKEGEKHELKLRFSNRGGAVAGIVLDPENKPVEGALVKVGGRRTRQFPTEDGHNASEAGPVQTRTNAEGRFEVKGLYPGENPIAIRAKRWASWTKTVDVVAGGVYRVEARLGESAIIRGRVTDASDAPLRGVVVCAGRYGDFTGSMAVTDKDGAYELVGVTPGDVAMMAEEDGYQTATAKLVVAPGAELTWNVRLESGPSIAGRVVDHRGKPIEGVVGQRRRATGVPGRKRTPRASSSSRTARATPSP